jgi:hypothetical protein
VRRVVRRDVADPLHAEKRPGKKASPAPAKKQPKKINTKESATLHAYRASGAADVRHLPRRLQGPMFSHIIMADKDGELRRYAWEWAAEYSAAIAPKYKLPVASAQQIRKASPELMEMGLIFYVLDEADYIDRNGKPRANRINDFEVDRIALELHAVEAKVESENKAAEKTARRAEQKARYEAKRKARKVTPEAEELPTEPVGIAVSDKKVTTRLTTPATPDSPTTTSTTYSAGQSSTAGRASHSSSKASDDETGREAGEGMEEGSPVEGGTARPSGEASDEYDVLAVEVERELTVVC